MSPSTRPIQEEELHAFVDGKLDAARYAEIAAMMQHDPLLAARLDDWRHEVALLREAFAFKAREPVPARLNLSRRIEQRVSRSHVRWQVAAGFLLALSLGGATGWMARDRHRPSDMEWLTMQATAAHRVFVSDIERPVELGPTNRTELVGWMSERLERRVEVPDLSRLGYRFIGGRVLAAVGGPAAMLMYDDINGNRITVYMQPMTTAEQLPMRPVARGAVAGYAWISRQTGFSVMSNGAGSGLHTLASKVRDDMHS